jgi:4-diphosphocytidyl-2-C-methyl-D-erythritol kinase
LPLLQTAYAKLNLALHVRGRRDDGYHEIETLFAFASCGDKLRAKSAPRDEFRVYGEFADQLSNPFDNLVVRALNLLPNRDPFAVTLEKNLPVAAGLGGGSADAGAVFRLVATTFGLPDDWEERAAQLGADVPACVESYACVGRGTGTELEPVHNDLHYWGVLLVNPRVPLATASVFAGWDGIDHGPLPEGPVSQIAEQGRNDLEGPAIALCPAIAEVLDELRQTDADFVRMSGSGATCFALFRSHDVMRNAKKRLALRRPGWWQAAGHLL